MSIRIIVLEPDDVLHKVAKEVTKITPNVQKLLDDMADTMYEAEGVGLAAPQVGILKRLIVVDAGDEHGLIKMINPEIVAEEGEELGPEGQPEYTWVERGCASCREGYSQGTGPRG